MKKIFILMALLASTGMFIMAGSAMAVPGDGVAGSVHDMSVIYGKLGAGDTVCTPCHTPHNAGGTADAPLSNRNDSAGPYDVYTNADTFDGEGGITIAGSVSGMCLSCHDGTQGLDSYGGTAGTVVVAGQEIGNTTTWGTANALANIGTDLRGEHPVAFTYTTNATDSGMLGTAPLTTDTPLFSGNVECASCHAVHNNLTNANLLRLTPANLCKNCHDK